MKTKLQYLSIVLALLALSTLNSQLSTAFAQGTAFTYQGRVQDNGTNFTGAGQFEFALVTSTNTSSPATATANMGGTNPNEFVNGYTLVNGGSGYTTAPAVTVSAPGGSGTTATATATVSGGAVTAINIISPGSGYTSTPTVTIAPPPANIIYVTYWSNDGTSSAGSEPSASVAVAVNNGLFTVVMGDTTLANMTAIPVAVFTTQPDLQLRIWFNDGVNGFGVLSPLQNLTPTPYAVQSVNALNAVNATTAVTVSGNVSASQLTGAIASSLLPGFQGSDNAIGGGVGNSTGGTESVISGGVNNTNNANQSAIGGGGGNIIQTGAYYSFIGSGGGNLIQTNAYDAFIGSGYHNTVQANAVVAAIGGGQFNTVLSNATFSVIGGGYDNTNTGPYAVIPGGESNVAGSNSFAAGSFAQATNRGSFVWADDEGTVFASTTTNQFAVRAAGGATFVTGGKGMTLDGQPVFAGLNGSGLVNLNASQVNSGKLPQAQLPAAAVTNTESGVTLSNLTANGILTLPPYDYYGVNPLSIYAGTNLLLRTGISGSFYFGPDAGNTNNYAQQNTAFGNYALNAITSGYNDVAIGMDTLAANTSGGDNTATGLGALYVNTTANDNTAYGFAALGENATGSNNVAVGSSALAYLGGTTDGGSANIALGYNAGSAYTANESSNIDIGNVGVAGENRIIRIGTQGVQTACYIAGTVYANNVLLTSDRNAKENFQPVDPRTVLDKVAALPVSEWNYKADSRGVQHIGPMAQDFQTAFRLDGPDDKHISVVDESGVALAAIQGLNQKLQEELNRQSAENAKLKQQNDSLAERLNELEATVKQLAANK